VSVVVMDIAFIIPYSFPVLLTAAFLFGSSGQPGGPPEGYSQGQMDPSMYGAYGGGQGFL
jgi:hypothetical protein